VEAQIVNSHAADRDSPPAFETIYNGVVEDAADPILITDDTLPQGTEGEDGPKQHVFAVWKLPVFLARPRIRLQGPSVVFFASASLKPPPASELGPVKDGYLQSRVPAGLNLLEAFSSDPLLKGAKPRLSALRVSKVAPLTQAPTQSLPMKGLQSLKLRIYPAVHTRVRFARPNTTPPSPALIALLEVDFTPFFDCEVRLDKINLSITDGTVEDLTAQDGMNLPLSCVAHDHVTFLYRLAPQKLDMVSKPPTRDLDIAIQVTALVRPDGPDLCMPVLNMAWTTALDFTLPLNPGFGQPMTQPIQRAHRPSQLSIGDAQSFVAPSVSRPDALPSLEAASKPTEANLPDFGITMTFTGPSGPVYAGEEFLWSVFVVNRSRPDESRPLTSATSASTSSQQITAASAPPPTSSSRKLALLAIPKRRRNELRVIRPPSTSGAGHKRDPLVADAVMDENVVHAMQRNSLVDATDIICLSADVRVGPLAPNACAVVELRFIAMRAGVVGVEAVRVVDLGSQEHVDVRELPVVVVQEREEG
jgi:hypothetical protein